jgi:hypothetical protein
MRLGEAAGRRPESAQPTEMPNALSPISTTVVETRLQQPAAANAIASAKKKRFTDKTHPPLISPSDSWQETERSATISLTKG